VTMIAMAIFDLAKLTMAKLTMAERRNAPTNR
jgi:hypothetical protein